MMFTRQTECCLLGHLNVVCSAIRMLFARPFECCLLGRLNVVC